MFILAEYGLVEQKVPAKELFHSLQQSTAF